MEAKNEWCESICGDEDDITGEENADDDAIDIVGAPLTPPAEELDELAAIRPEDVAFWALDDNARVSATCCDVIAPAEVCEACSGFVKLLIEEDAVLVDVDVLVVDGIWGIIDVDVSNGDPSEGDVDADGETALRLKAMEAYGSKRSLSIIFRLVVVRLCVEKKLRDIASILYIMKFSE